MVKIVRLGTKYAAKLTASGLRNLLTDERVTVTNMSSLHQVGIFLKIYNE